MPPIVTAAAGAIVAERYRLDRVLGEGGMGVVWAATHVITRKPFALKLVKRADADGGARRARVLREARAACAVQHPNVCEVHDVIDIDGGAPVMVMEYLLGESLGARIARDGKLSLGDAAAVAVQLCSAVGAAHARGIVHRDLKPENVFLVGGDAARVKVLDFGIAKLTATEGDAAATAQLTETGTRLGTPYFMAPEQAFGERDVDHRADVWAIGLILYQCLTGVLPTAGDNAGQVLKNIVARKIPPIESLSPELPSELCDVIGRMLSRSRAARPSSLAEVLSTLAPFTKVTVPAVDAPAAMAPSSAPGDFTATDDVPAAVDLEAKARERAAPTSSSSSNDAVTASVAAPPLPAARPARRARWGIAVAALVVAGIFGVWRLSGGPGAAAGTGEVPHDGPRPPSPKPNLSAPGATFAAASSAPPPAAPSATGSTAETASAASTAPPAKPSARPPPRRGPAPSASSPPVAPRQDDDSPLQTKW